VNWRPWAAFVALCVIWGTPYFFIKIAVQEVSPVWIAFGRIASGAVILLPIAWKRGSLRAVWKHKPALLAFALAEMVIPFLAISFAESWLSSSLTGILIAAAPMGVIFFSPLFGLKERVSARLMLGLMIGFGGVATLLGLDASVHGWHDWLGVGLLMIAAAGYSIGPLVVQRYLGEVDELGAVAVSLTFATLLLLPIAIATVPSVMPSTHVLLSIAALGILCTAVAMSMFFYVIVAIGASRASIVAYVNPAVAALLGVWVLHEPFGLNTALGLGLILVGSWLATRARSAPQSAALATDY